MDLMGNFFCWYHTLCTCFIPNINKYLKKKFITETIINIIREIYSAKTIERRSSKVDQQKKFLDEEELLFNYFNNNNYLNDNLLDKWTSLVKISQYCDPSNNYIERLFGEVEFFILLK